MLNQDNLELFVDYKNFKCNGFTDWYETFGSFPWVIPSYDPSYDDLTAQNKKIGINVFSNKDPYVWANYNGTLHFSNLAENYSIAGVWLISCAVALILIPVLIYFKDPNKNELEENKEESEDNDKLIESSKTLPKLQFHNAPPLK